MNKSLEIIERYNKILQNTEEITIKRINKALVASLLRLEDQLRLKYPKLKENNSLLPSQRAILLAAELKNLLLITGNYDFQAEFLQLTQLATANGLKLGSLLIDVVESNDFIKATANIPLEALKYAAEEQTQRLQRWGQDFSNKATSIVEQALILGWGTDKTAKAIATEAGTTMRHAEQIARTASISASNQAVQAQFKANGVDYFQFTATNDDRVCPYCITRNMRVYELGASRPPLHVNCRCFSMPWKPQWQRLGLTKDNWAKDFRQKTLEEAKVDPNYGPAPFEKAAGVTQAPQPYWEP